MPDLVLGLEDPEVYKTEFLSVIELVWDKLGPGECYKLNWGKGIKCGMPKVWLYPSHMTKHVSIV